MKFSRDRYQKVNLRRVERNSGADVWEYRYRNHAEPGNPARQITLSTLEYPTESKALVRLQEDLLRINGPEAYRGQIKPTLELVIDRFLKEERLEEILKQISGETTIHGRTFLQHGSPIPELPQSAHRAEVGHYKACRRQSTCRGRMAQVAASISPKTKRQVKAVTHLLVERAMLWGLLDLQRNSIELVKVKNSSRRLKKPQTITPEKFQELVAILRESHKTMVTVAMLTGL